MKPTRLLAFLSLLLGLLTSCELFDNEQIPECLKTSGEQSPDILTCNNPLFFERPDWHPDGNWIAAEHADSIDTNNDGLNDALFSGIWLINAQNGQTQPLLPFGSAPDWNPEGTHLAVHAGGGIYTIRITSLEPAKYDTSSITLLTTFNASAFFPTWSSNGQWIAFDSNYMSGDGGYSIWKIKPDGTDIVYITKGRIPHWSPKEKKIVFTALYSEIYLYDEQKNNLLRLTTRNGDEINATNSNWFPKFSPDGRKIGYEHRPEGLSTSLWVMNSDGSNKKRVARSWSSDMAWSPDSKKIVYVFSNHHYDVPGNGQLWIMNADGSHKKQLTLKID